MGLGKSKRRVFKGHRFPRAPRTLLPDAHPHYAHPPADSGLAAANPSEEGKRADELSSSVLLPEDDETQRRCLITGNYFPKDKLIRFVVGPEHALVPDLEGKLPGRGLWASPDRALLTQAFAKNPFTRSAKNKVVIAPDLLETLEKLLAKRCLAFIGLSKSAGLIVAGQAQVEQAAKAHNLAFLLVAADAGQDGLKKLSFAEIPLIRGLKSTDLGPALGHDHLVYLGFKPHPLTNKLKNELIRWQNVAFGAMKDGNTQETENT